MTTFRKEEWQRAGYNEQDFGCWIALPEMHRVIVLEACSHTTKSLNCVVHLSAFSSLILFIPDYTLHESRHDMATHAKERKILFMGFRSVGEY